MKKDFWSKSTVAVIGGGSWGSVLASVISQNVKNVHVWVRDYEQAKLMNETRSNPKYVKDLVLAKNVTVTSDFVKLFESECQVIIWCLPSKVCRELAKQVAPYLKGNELILHATKGVEEGSMKRVSTILREELPCRRIGVISGPNLAGEIAKNEPAATVVASEFNEVVEAGVALLTLPQFRVYAGADVVGVEWAGTLKNIFAIAAGVLDALKLGWNARALLLTRGLAEMTRFGVAMGADEGTFLGLAGVGDLMATCSSPLSRNYRVGFALASGKPLDQILKDLGATAEGVRTTQILSDFAKERKIYMPITHAVSDLLEGKKPLQETLNSLMSRPAMPDIGLEKF